VSRSLQEESTLKEVQRPSAHPAVESIQPSHHYLLHLNLNHLLVSGPLPLIFCVCVADTT